MNNYLRFTLALAATFIGLTHSSITLADALYVASNKADNNTVVAFKQLSNGHLKTIGEFKTGGKGTGDLEVPALKKDVSHPLMDGVDPLISAYGIYKTDDNKHVLVVNAGSRSISAFRVESDYRLTLTSTAETKGKFPISIASHADAVYVASVGMDNNNGSIEGFTIDKNGILSSHGEKSFVDLKARPSSIAFTTSGDFLIVSELVTGNVKSFSVNDGQLESLKPVSFIESPSGNEERFLPIPVGFTIVNKNSGDKILVSEARFLTKEGGFSDKHQPTPQSQYTWQTGSTSSYGVDENGMLTLVSGDVLTGNDVNNGELANCWVAASPDGQYLWAANALSSSISSYHIADNGKLTLINSVAYKDYSEQLFFSDIFVSKDGKYLNQLIGNKGNIAVFKILSNGELELQQILHETLLPDVGSYGAITL